MKKKKRALKVWLFLAIVILVGFGFVGGVGAIPQIEFVDPTPSDGTKTTNTTIEINVSITESDLGEMKFNWNGTNYTFYDDSLVLMMNFDNVSALGESYNNSNGSVIVDVSNYSNNGTLYVGDDYSGNYTTGRYGGAFEFDGIDDYVVIDGTSDFNFSGKNLTFSFWVNQKGDGPYNPSAVIAPSGTLWWTTDSNLWFWIYNNGNFNLRIWNTTN